MQGLFEKAWDILVKFAFVVMLIMFAFVFLLSSVVLKLVFHVPSVAIDGAAFKISLLFLSTLFIMFLLPKLVWVIKWVVYFFTALFTCTIVFIIFLWVLRIVGIKVW